MKPWPTLLALALLAATGCTLLDRKHEMIEAPKLKPVPVLVRPDDVTPSNAREMARRLNEELDRDLDAENAQP